MAPFLTLCQDECPLVTGAFIALQRDVSAAGLGNKVVFMEITVDPGRDTPARLAAYSKEFGADWVLLTGTPANLDALWKFLGVSVQIVPEEQPAKIDWCTGKPLTYDVDHTDGYFLIDASGHERFSDSNPPDLHGHLDQKLTGLLNAGGLKNLDDQGAPNWTLAAGAVIAQLAGRTDHPISVASRRSMESRQLIRSERRSVMVNENNTEAEIQVDDVRRRRIRAHCRNGSGAPSGRSGSSRLCSGCSGSSTPGCSSSPSCSTEPSSRPSSCPTPADSRRLCRGSSRTSATSSSPTSRCGTRCSRSIQLVIGLGLFFPTDRSARARAVLRLGPRRLGAGRRAGDGPDRHAPAALTGAPGSVLMYGLIGLMAWPTHRTDDTAVGVVSSAARRVWVARVTPLAHVGGLLVAGRGPVPPAAEPDHDIDLRRDHGHGFGRPQLVRPFPPQSSGAPSPRSGRGWAWVLAIVSLIIGFGPLLSPSPRHLPGRGGVLSFVHVGRRAGMDRRHLLGFGHRPQHRTPGHRAGDGHDAGRSSPPRTSAGPRWSRRWRRHGVLDRNRPGRGRPGVLSECRSTPPPRRSRSRRP